MASSWIGNNQNRANYSDEDDDDWETDADFVSAGDQVNNFGRQTNKADGVQANPQMNLVSTGTKASGATKGIWEGDKKTTEGGGVFTAPDSTPNLTVQPKDEIVISKAQAPSVGLFGRSQQPAPPPPKPEEPEPPPPIPTAWQAVQDDAGDTYYWNSETNETTWDRPPEMDMPPVVGRNRADSSKADLFMAQMADPTRETTLQHGRRGTVAGSGRDLQIGEEGDVVGAGPASPQGKGVFAMAQENAMLGRSDSGDVKRRYSLKEGTKDLQNLALEGTGSADMAQQVLQLEGPQAVLGQEGVMEARNIFNSFDEDKSGMISTSELGSVMRKLGEHATEERLKGLMDEVDSNKSGSIEFNEFLTIYAQIHIDKLAGKSTHKGFANIANKQKQQYEVKSAHGKHSFNEEEKVAFANYITNALSGDDFLVKKAKLLPISVDDMDLFDKVSNGVVFCKLVNHVAPDTIDERAINMRTKLSLFEVTENMNLCINACKGIGCRVVNIGAADLIEGRPHLVLGLIWQLVRIGLLAKINLREHPELYRLLQPGEELEALLKLPAEQILLRWINYHMEQAGRPERAKNFGKDLKDSVIYTVLLDRVAPKEYNLGLAGLAESDLSKRAGMVIQNAQRIGVDQFSIQVPDIVKGNDKLNLGFVAAIFNTYHGLDPPEETVDLSALLEVPDDDVGDSREERAFRMWMNSLGIENYVNNLFEDCKDGIIILQTMDKVEPGIVDWSKVNMAPKMVFKKIENCNYAVELGKQMKFSLVAIDGKDISDGYAKLILALMWQLMRYDIVKFLSSLKGASGKAFDDKDIVTWGNSRVQASGSPQKITGFSDSTLKTGLYFADLIKAVEPRAIDPALVTKGSTEEEQMLNAKYVISCARKIGCVVFMLWEDIVEVKPKMMLCFVASVMAVDLKTGGR